MKLTNLFLKRTVVFLLCIITIFLSGCGYPTPNKGGCFGDDCDEDVIDANAIENYTPYAKDHFAGILIFAEADDDTLFYDKITGESQTFNYLLDRQFSLLAEHIIFALESFYGDGITGPSDRESEILPNLTYNEFNLVAIDNGLNSELRACSHSGSNRIQLSCPECLSWMAYLKSDITLMYNPFYFFDAIDGGYLFDAESGMFDESELVEELAWVGKDSLSVDLIKRQLAKIIATGEYSSLSEGDVSELDYESYLSSIDHLGFTSDYIREEGLVKGELNIIKEFILNSIIGEFPVIFDDNIHSMLVHPQYEIIDYVELRPDAADPFEDEEAKHYYKGYRNIVSHIVDRAVTISVRGYYPYLGEYGSGSDYAAYPQLPRMNIIYKNFDDLNDMDVYNETTYTQILEDTQKIKSILCLPRLEPYLSQLRLTHLEQEYGYAFAIAWDELDAYYLTRDWFFNFVASNEGENEEFIVKLKFDAKAQGEQIIDDYIPSLSIFESENLEFYTIDGDLVVMTPDKLTELGVIHDLEELGSISSSQAQKFAGWYHLNADLFSNIKKRRFFDYDGVPIINNNGNLRSGLFINDSLDVWSGLFEIAPKFDAGKIGEFIVGTDAIFNSGNNYFEIILEYYDKETKEQLAPQDINLILINAIDLIDPEGLFDENDEVDDNNV